MTTPHQTEHSHHKDASGRAVDQPASHLDPDMPVFQASDHATRLAVQSEQALQRLRLAIGTDADVTDHVFPASEPIDQTPTLQMRRHHVVIVNSDPAFLDAVRVLLQGNDYNVTTTNLVPRSYDLIKAAGTDVLVIDLTIEEPAVWSLVEQVRKGEQTRRLPVIFTATNPELLERAERQNWPAGGRFIFLKPFQPADLRDAVHALTGPA